MKQIIFVVVGVILIIIFSISINRYLESSSENISKHIDYIILYSNNDDWNKAYSEYELCINTWNETQDIWATLIEHSEIDSIDSSITKLSKYITTKDLTLTQAESSNLKLLLKHIPELYILNLKNIL